MGCKHCIKLKGGYICDLFKSGINPDACCGCRSFQAPSPKPPHISQHPHAVRGKPSKAQLSRCAAIGKTIEWAQWEQ